MSNIEKTEHATIMYLECECRGTDHVVRLMFDEAHEDHPDMYISVQMNHYKNFWGRLRLAFNFLFARKKEYCHWAECLVDHESAVRLEEQLNKFNRLPGRSGNRPNGVLGPDWGGGC